MSWKTVNWACEERVTYCVLARPPHKQNQERQAISVKQMIDDLGIGMLERMHLIT